MFVKRADGVEMQFSISANFADVRVVITREGESAPMLDLLVPDLGSVRIERDGSRSWLHMLSSRHGLLQMAVAPTITITLDGRISA